MKEVNDKANLSITHYHNISFLIIGIFFIKKPLPIASINILSILDRNYHAKYLNRKDHLRCILKDLTAVLKR